MGDVLRHSKRQHRIAERRGITRRDRGGAQEAGMWPATGIRTGT
ncbi:hypothetical protein CSHISOI_07105 [Colletotrichum shisoi]|uniref:Uncharacterized protein n=1 Tax=Colletotrichum shisoi TaxID=2078593 RepID=A0A5Q4BNS3_9PEZI|nr:hypothetical protein CSHISOI_07105 [Colletotrichum shisoi]